MIDVVVSGARGRMGTCVIDAVSSADDMRVVGCYDPFGAGASICCGDETLTCSDNLEELISQTHPHVLVDFTNASAVLQNAACALSKGVHVVTGTTGVPRESFAEVWKENSDGSANLFFAPNFTTGAVLMMKFAQMAAKFFPDIEIIELHHDGKKDAPSGTAVQTARLMAAERSVSSNKGPGSETEIAGCEGARGCDVEGIRIHSVRGDGFMASQEVILSDKGQNLTIRHDSSLRTAYMPGVLLAIRSVGSLKDGFSVGLDTLMGI